MVWPPGSPCTSPQSRRAPWGRYAQMQMELTMFKFVAFLNDETGATAAEYGLILALVAGVIVVAVTALGNDVSAAITNVANAIAGA